MMRLLRLELQRSLVRRLTRIVLLAAVLGIAVNGVVQFVTHEKGDDASLDAQRERQIAFFIDQCATGQFGFDEGFTIDEHGNRMPLQEQGRPGSPERRAECERQVRERVADGSFGIGVHDERFHLESLRGGLLGLTVPLVMLALLLAASYVGAEWRANTVATQLVWEPRRLRVGTAKLLAAVITAVGIYVFLQALAAASVLPAALFRGTTDVPAGWLGSYLGAGLRGAGLVAVAAAAGYALGSAGRNTAAAIGFAFVYLMILEGGLIGSIWPGTRRWLVVGNSIVWVSGEPSFEIAGRSVVGAGLVLLAYAGALVAASLVLFRTRDVT